MKPIIFKLLRSNIKQSLDGQLFAGVNKREYITGIFDRVLADVTNRTPKGFLNVLDWERIYNNSQVVNELVNSTLDLSILFNQLGAVGIRTVPNVEDINRLLENIERTRTASGLPVITGLVEIEYNWVAGSNEEAPDYLIVNTWEEVLDIIYYGIVRSSEYWIPCGIASAGQSRFWQHGFR